ncbi:hypothetical protein M9Q43_09040 [Flavobacterium sp. HXWNR29]|uniref:hypothetical protein n=1 Tax=Flavobacterium odoriferum TaxID=2946604 RepID=UPI0021CB8E0A|nr:hypothetical protein [Flavobacterium sp. HXWNR29]MCU4189308.1 hypothetical protein [Flavobacterium sp. HXWNR29]
MEVITGENKNYFAYAYTKKEFFEISFRKSICILSTVYTSSDSENLLRKYFYIKFVNDSSNFVLKDDYFGYKVKDVFIIPITNENPDEIINDIRKKHNIDYEL